MERRKGRVCKNVGGREGEAERREKKSGEYREREENIYIHVMGVMEGEGEERKYKRGQMV